MTQHHRWIRLCNPETGKAVFTAGFTAGDPGAAWGWVLETMREEHGAHEDDVGCVEDPEGGGDLVTFEGVPHYRIRHGLAN